MSDQPHRSQLSTFFRTEYRHMVRYAQGLIEDAAERDGEDIVQDVMAGLLTKADITVPINNLASYLYQALRNRVVDMLRRRRDQVSLDAPVVDSEESSTFKDLIADVSQDASALVEQKQVRSAILEAIGGLSDEQRAVVIATEIHERSFSDLSEEWGVPIGTLLARKSRAFQAIRNKIAHLEYHTTTTDQKELKGAMYG